MIVNYLIGAVAFVGAVVAACYVFSTFTKGRIFIRLKNFRPVRGNNIEGVVEVYSKKLLPSQGVTIALVCLAEEKKLVSGKVRRTKLIEVYRTELQLQSTHAYQPGEKRTFDFSFVDYPLTDPGIDNYVFVQLKVGNTGWRGEPIKKFRWFLLARLECLGFDLIDRKAIYFESKVEKY